MPTIDAGFEHLSLYQMMIFQSKFDFQLNDDYLQNATFICSSPSYVPLSSDGSEQSNLVESKCKAVTTIKKCIIQNILPASSGYQELQENLKYVRSRISQLERNFENSFLVASEQTLKNMDDYAKLKQAVEDLIQGQDQRADFSRKLKDLLTETHVISDAARVIYFMYMALKIVSKVMHEVTYSWNQFVIVLHKVIFKVIHDHKIAVVKDMRKGMTAKQLESAEHDLEEVVIEVDHHFFREQLLPAVHQVISCNVKTDSSSFFNLVFALLVAQANGEIEERECQYVLNQFVALKEFWKWRQCDSHFVSMTDRLEANKLHLLKSELLQLYPDMSRQVFDNIASNLGQNFTYAEASLFFQKQLRVRYNLKPFQLITYGFLCPDSEFKGRLVQFMYTVLQETLEFTENLPSFHTFLQSAEWKEQPITVITSASLNPVNLVTSIANFYKRKLLVLRADPVTEMARTSIQPYSAALTDKINNQLLDFSAVRQEGQGINHDRLRGLSVNVISEPIPEEVPLAKQHWNVLKQRQANLDEGSLLATLNGDNKQISENDQLEQILECARNGSWVLICPVQFPQYVGKLKEQLRDIVDEISNDFRLIFDLQGTAQNEIPDSFIFDCSVTFQLSENNADQLCGFNDIWSRVLDQSCLNILQDVGISVGDNEERKKMAEETHKKLRHIESQSEEWGAPEKPAIKLFEEQMMNDPQQTALFKEYVKVNASEFSQIYQAQRAETRIRLDEEKVIIAQRKAAIIEAAKLNEKNNRFKSRANEHSSGLSLPLKSSSQAASRAPSVHSNSDMTRPVARDIGSTLLIQQEIASPDLLRNQSQDMITETSKTERASRDGRELNIKEELKMQVIVDIDDEENKESDLSASEMNAHAQLSNVDVPISRDSDFVDAQKEDMMDGISAQIQQSRSVDKIEKSQMELDQEEEKNDEI